MWYEKYIFGAFVMADALDFSYAENVFFLVEESLWNLGQNLLTKIVKILNEAQKFIQKVDKILGSLKW